MSDRIFKFNGNNHLLLMFDSFLIGFFLVISKISAMNQNPTADFDGDGK